MLRRDCEKSRYIAEKVVRRLAASKKGIELAGEAVATTDII